MRDKIKRERERMCVCVGVCVCVCERERERGERYGLDRKRPKERESFLELCVSYILLLFTAAPSLILSHADLFEIDF